MGYEMNPKLLFPYLFFVCGIGFDILTTLVGVFHFHIAEANPLGFYGAIIVNIVLISITYLILKYKSPEKDWQILLIRLMLFIVGAWRYVVGVLNIIFMRG